MSLVQSLKPAPRARTTRILLVGGVFAFGPEYRSIVGRTPETTLEQGLRSRGYSVETLPHDRWVATDRFDIVHVHHFGEGALRAAIDPGRARFVFTPHGYPRKLLHAVLLRQVMGRADAVV